MENITHLDTTEGVNNDSFDMSSLGMGSEACCNVADFFSILRDWELEFEQKGEMHGK